MVTIVDVAAAAQVSRQTVSNVLNTPEKVRPATRQRVTTAIEKLGYRPHLPARRLRTQEFSVLGMRFDSRWDEGTGSLLDRFLHELIDQAGSHGVRVQLYTSVDAEDEIQTIRELSESRQVDGFVLTSSYRGDRRLSWLEQNQIPCVLFGRPWTDRDDSTDLYNIPWVDVDGAAGTAQATEAFRSDGMSTIAYLGWPTRSATGADRRAGWAASMRATAGSVSLAELSAISEEDIEAAHVATDKILDRLPGVEAIVCASDTLALGALSALQDRARLDVEVSGFDNSRISQLLELSTVDQNLREVARLAFAQLSSPSEDPCSLVVPTFIRRTATGRLRIRPVEPLRR
ncbi:LacI family DNA-binding transcriptional regulator [Leifsonia aquatica]|uniref:LacI family DNA-binding transcriptional regulator n=1 Tax=Leifsonia aquatica TaxID=144185 RepID=UPI00384D7C2D